jgi:hypothetical protein
MLTSNTELTWRERHYTLTPAFKQAFLLAIVAGVLWWGFALSVKQSGIMMLIWDDQRATFTTGYLLRPYDAPGFINPPWAMLLLVPFSLLHFETAVLLQMTLYFVILTGIIFKFGGKKRLLLAVIVVLFSPLALNTALEINIDWMIALGLLVPPAWSAPLLLIKPQSATGYIAGFSRRDLMRCLILALLTLLLSFIIWGNWIPLLLHNIEVYSISPLVNLAPMAILRAFLSPALGTIVSLLMGAALLWQAFRRHDPVLGLFGGLFCVPYLAGYSLMLPFTLIAARYPRIAAVINMALWLGVLQVVLPLVGQI